MTSNNTIWHLSSCDTCRRILKETASGTAAATFREIKSNPITPEELDCLRNIAGSYVTLLNLRARKLQSPEFKTLEITEATARRLILEDYTFLKRPVYLLDGRVFAGNSPEAVSAMKSALGI
jgi:arsenate reductase